MVGIPTATHEMKKSPLCQEKSGLEKAWIFLLFDSIQM